MMKWLFVIFTFYCSEALYSQHIEGVIFDDQTGLPIGSATITLTSLLNSSKILAFTLSNAQGVFKIQIPDSLEDSSRLVVRHLTFETLEVIRKVSDTSDLHLRLTPNTFELSEVIIQKTTFSHSKQDTLSIDVDSLTSKNTTYLEDLLYEIEGIKISEKGAITYYGKPLEKVFIEGYDIAGTGYQLLTRNVNSEALRTIEIITNFEEEEIYRDIIGGDGVAININLKEDYKQRVFGSMHAGYGYENSHDLETTVIPFGKILKGIFVVDANNIGIKNEESHKQNTSEADRAFLPAALDEQLIINHRRPSFEFEDIQRSTLNNEVVGSGRFVNHIGKRMKLKSGLSYRSDRINTSSLTKTETQLERTIRYSESTNRRDNENAGFGYAHLNFQINNNNKLKLQWNGNYENAKIKNYSSFNDFQINEQIESDNSSQVGFMSYILKLSKRSALTFRTSLREVELNEDYLADSSFFQSDRSDFIQSLKQGKLTIKAESDLKIKTISGNWEVKTGFIRQYYDLKFQRSAFASIPAFESSPNEGQVQSEITQWYFSQNLRHYFSSYSLAIGFDLRHFNVSRPGLNDHLFLVFVPKGKFNWNVSGNSSLEISYNQSNELVNEINYSNVNLVKNYQSLIVYNSVGLQRGIKSNSITLNFKTKVVDWRILLSGSHVKKTDDFGNFTQLAIPIFIQQKIILRPVRNSWVSLDLEKYIDELQTSFQFHGSFLTGQNRYFIGFDLTQPPAAIESKSNDWTYGISLKRKIMKGLHFRTNTEFNQNRIRNLSQQETSISRNKNFQWKNELKLSSKESPFDISISFKVFNFLDGGTMHFLDFGLAYKIRKSEFQFKLNNILNQNIFTLSEIEDFSFTVTKQRLLPFNGLFYWKFSF